MKSSSSFMWGVGGAAEQPNAEDAKESQRSQKIPGKNYEIYSFQRLMGKRFVLILLVSTHTRLYPVALLPSPQPSPASGRGRGSGGHFRPLHDPMLQTKFCIFCVLCDSFAFSAFGCSAVGLFGRHSGSKSSEAEFMQ